MNATDLLEEHARDLLGAGPDWKAYRWEVLPHDGKPFYFAVTGAVTHVLYKTGICKGRPNVNKSEPGTHRTANIQFAEHVKWLLNWERRTGKCRTCFGEGRLVARVSTSAPTEYRPCPHCEATGKAVVKEERDNG